MLDITFLIPPLRGHLKQVGHIKFELLKTNTKGKWASFLLKRDSENFPADAETF